MTHEEFISLVKEPGKVTAHHVNDLKELVERFPYFVPARLFLAKALQLANSIYAESGLTIASLYVPERRWLFYYMHPEKMVSNKPYHHIRNENSTGNYFDMMNGIERGGGDTKESLKNLAERLKSARAMVIGTPVAIKKESKEIIPENQKVEIKFNKGMSVVTEDYFSLSEPEITEDNAKKLISERKYRQAIVILKELNLNNPKKSVYFADQIRFLEKVIENSKK